MAVEVISLLSSSPPASPAPSPPSSPPSNPAPSPAPSPKTHPPPATAAAPAHYLTQSWAFPDVSPEEAPAKKRPPHGGFLDSAGSSPHKTTGQALPPSLRPTQRPKRSGGDAHTSAWMIMSDDDDIVWNLDELMEPSPIPKRRRLSPDVGDKHRRQRTRSPSSPGRSSSGGALWPAGPQANTARNGSRGPAKSPEHGLFVSPSPIHKDRSSVPSKPLGGEQSGPDPFGSSPRLPKSQPIDQALFWNPTPDLAPAGKGLRKKNTAAKRPPKLPSRGPSPEIIDLVDSDDENPQASSDSELPSVENILAGKSIRARPASPDRAPVTAPKKTAAPPKKATKRSDPQTALDKAERAAAREAEKERKKREKEREKQDKEAAKEQRKLEKQKAAALAEVNKVRTDRRCRPPEMIVDLPSTLSETARLQAETLLQNLEVEHHAWESPVPDVVKWRRKVCSVYNGELGLWEPVPLRIEEESHIVVILAAQNFVSLAVDADGAGLEVHVSEMKHHFAQHTVIYLIEGLAALMRKSKTVRNRQFVSAVRNAGNEAGPSGSQAPAARKRSKKSKAPEESVDEDTVEDALLSLQVSHGALIHHTDAPVETAQWIAVFTQHISTVPYRRQKDELNDGAGFCMESGQFRSGDDANDTFVRMLQEITRVTAPIAYGIAAEFSTVPKLVRGLQAGGPLALQDCHKSANRDGVSSDRLVGQAASRKIYKVFTGQDETSTDI